MRVILRTEPEIDTLGIMVFRLIAATILLASSCAQGAPAVDEDVRSSSGRDVSVPTNRDLGVSDAPTPDLATADMSGLPDASAPVDMPDLTVDMGNCPNGCGAGEVCRPEGCVDVCAAANAVCGDVEGVDCGTCGPAEVCEAGSCVAPCAITAAECGSLTWSSATVDCGTCATGTCYANQCAAPGYRSIGAGFAHTCATSSNGQVKCWGSNAQGTLGGVGGNSPVPRLVSGLSGLAAVSTFNQHVCASKPTGAWCWGTNSVGQLGNGSLAASSNPVVVTGAFDYLRITTGGGHSCGLRADGTAECWGANGQGQLGIGVLTTSESRTKDVVGLTNLTTITAGSVHTCALRDDGNVYCWGWNDKGQLGNTLSVASTPTRVQNLMPAIAIAAGGSHTCAVVENLDVWCWGEGVSGQLGRGSTASSNVPVKSSMTSAVALVAGSTHTCAIDTNRRLWCWGGNAGGQLGIGSRAQANQPTQVGTLTNILDAGAGFDHTCATRDDGTALCWGANGVGQLGNNSTADALTPVTVAP